MYIEMESITNAAEEVLVDALSFKLPGSGQYVQERRSVTFHPEGSNAYSAQAGTRVIRFKLATEGWLDPGTVRIFMGVVNADQTNNRRLRPIGLVHAFFRHLRITMRGVVIEDISDYARVHEMFDILATPQARKNAQAEGFGYDRPVDELNTLALLPGIARFQTVCFKPLAGILQQAKYIPLRYCPLELELELNDTDQPIINSIYEPFNNTNTSDFWRLENCMLKADLCTLDNALDNNYVAHLLGGKQLNIVYNTFISNIQTILSGDTQINVSRSLTKLRSVFISLQRDIEAQSARNNGINKLWNNFYSPMAQDAITRSTTHVEEGEIESLQLQVGAFMIPQYPIRSHAECYYSLRKRV